MAEQTEKDVKTKKANHLRRKEAKKAEKDAKRGTQFGAEHRFARIGAEKVRAVADQIRGLPINRALEVIKFTKKRGGYLLGKVMKSALANAEYQISDQKLDLDLDSLYVADVQAGEGPTMKRWMTRARGMAFPILRRFCHIWVTLAPRPSGRGGEEGGAGEAAEGSAAGKAAKKTKKKAAMAGAGAK
jgi:large subunit ribosomal protein L22